MVQKTEIPLSKKKMLLSLAGSLLFVLLGIWFILQPEQLSHGPLRNPVLVIIVGAVSILFFGAIAIVILKKMKGNPIGLTLSSEGIIDNSSGISSGIILWDDVVDITTTTVVNQKFVLILTKNPESYINRQTQILKKKTMQMNYKSYGSPICISANALQINFEDLHQIVLDYFSKYKTVAL